MTHSRFAPNGELHFDDVAFRRTGKLLRELVTELVKIDPKMSFLDWSTDRWSEEVARLFGYESGHAARMAARAAGEQEAPKTAQDRQREARQAYLAGTDQVTGLMGLEVTSQFDGRVTFSDAFRRKFSPRWRDAALFAVEPDMGNLVGRDLSQSCATLLYGDGHQEIAEAAVQMAGEYGAVVDLQDPVSLTMMLRDKASRTPAGGVRIVWTILFKNLFRAKNSAQVLAECARLARKDWRQDRVIFSIDRRDLLGFLEPKDPVAGFDNLILLDLDRIPETMSWRQHVKPHPGLATMIARRQA